MDNELLTSKKPGIKFEDYLITFPDIDNLVYENDQGEMFINVDIHHIDSNNNTTRIKENELTPELEQKIQEYINNFLVQAIEAEENNKNTDK